MKQYRVYAIVKLYYEKRAKHVVRVFYVHNPDFTYVTRKAIDLYGRSFIEIKSIIQVQ